MLGMADMKLHFAGTIRIVGIYYICKAIFNAVYESYHLKYPLGIGLDTASVCSGSFEITIYCKSNDEVMMVMRWQISPSR
jgi:hypothetical protein